MALHDTVEGTIRYWDAVRLVTIISPSTGIVHAFTKLTILCYTLEVDTAATERAMVGEMGDYLAGLGHLFRQPGVGQGGCSERGSVAGGRDAGGMRAGRAGEQARPALSTLSWPTEN